ncbi:MAG: sulfatase family protein [Roseibacillus sp.]
MAALVVVGFISLSSAGAAERPNIIYLMADDQNILSVGAYGNDEVQTPEMDKLAAEGVTFDRHYNTTAICMASRGNVFTGMYEYRTGTNFNHGDMKPEIWAKTYPVLLREAGYFTGFAGKFGMDVIGLGEGKKNAGLPAEDFDVWAGSPGQTSYATRQNESMRKYAEKYPHSTLSYGAFGQDFIREAAKQEKPFCLSISFKAPHQPTTPDPRFDDVYKGKTFTKPENYGREKGEHLSPQSKMGRQYERFISWKYDSDYDRVMATYYQQVYGIDVAVGMIREELEAQGLADNTVIIYTSDNGFICGSHGYGSKVLPMEESSRAPLMIVDPRSSSAGKKLRSGVLTGNVDFMPTIMELAGLPVPDGLDGVSLLPLLEEPDKDLREEMAFINVYGPDPTKSLTVLTKTVKYTYWWFGSEEMEPAEELFDLAEDPLELTNLAGSEEAAAKLEVMRQEYDRQLALWKKHADKEGAYAKYGTLFDRSIPWQEKTKLMKRKRKAEKASR